MTQSPDNLNEENSISSKRSGLIILKKIEALEKDRYIIKENDLNDILKLEIDAYYNKDDTQKYLQILNEICSKIQLKDE